MLIIPETKRKGLNSKFMLLQAHVTKAFSICSEKLVFFCICKYQIKRPGLGTLDDPGKCSKRLKYIRS